MPLAEAPRAVDEEEPHPNEKGKIERQIQYLRHAFFAARPFRDLDDLNAQFRRWRDDVAHQRRHPE